jgi:hypothetical protein
MARGFENENEIIFEFINNSNYLDLNENLRKVILTLNNNQIPNFFSANKYGGGDKADLSIVLDGKEFKLSIKMGNGNSFHQEKLEDFIDFIKLYLEDDEIVFNNLRFYIWGDGTLDGTGPMRERMSASQLKKKYPLKIQSIQNYFNRHKSNLIHRFLYGSVSKNSADFLLYGDVSNCIVVKESKLKELINESVKKPLSIGILTFQAWNRNINGGEKSENKRGSIQLKWGTLENDLINLK